MKTMEFWRVGQVTPRSVATDAPALEQSGWDGMLMGDSQCMVGDPYVALTVAAQHTTSIKLGIGVTNPVTRHASVAASAIAGLHEISGGRAALSIGRGDSSMAHIGLAPASPSVLEHYVRNLQAYLRGDGIEFDNLDTAGHRTVAELGALTVPDDSRLHWLDPTMSKVPVDVVASGPKVIAVAARHADQVTFGVGADEERLSWAIDLARQARIAVGLDPKTLSLGAYLNVVAHPDEEVALTLAAMPVAMFSRFSVMHGKVVGPVATETKANLERVAQSYDLREHGSGDARHRHSVDAEHIRSFGVVGTPDQCVDRLVRLAELGFDRVIVLGGYATSDETSHANMLQSREVLTDQVFPVVRERLAGTPCHSSAGLTGRPARN